MTAHERRAVWFAAVISLGGFLFGYDAAVISGVIGFVTTGFELNDWWVGSIVSAPSVGAILAALCVGPISDYVGRKRVMIALGLLYTLSALGSAFAPDAVSLLVARFVGGIAFGTLMLAPIYISELAPARLRGRMVSMNQLAIVIGFSAAYFSNYFLLGASESGTAFAQSLSLDQHVWRWMLGLELIPALLFVVMMTLAPESPRYLVMRGELDRATAILATIAPPDQLDGLLQTIRQSADAATQNLLEKIRDMLQPRMHRVLLVGLIAGIAQQSSGINVVFFTPTIFEQSGIGTNAAFAQATYVGLINVIFTLVAMALVDRLGRKPLMLAGLVGVAISMAVASWGFYTGYYILPADAASSLAASDGMANITSLAGQRFESDVAFKAAVADAVGQSTIRANEAALLQAAAVLDSRLVLLGILGFVASFAFSLGPVMWVLFSELFPNRIRGICMALMGIVNSGVSWFVQFIFPFELATLGSAGTFLVFSLASVLFLLLLAWLLPETRGKSLEQLEAELTGAT